MCSRRTVVFTERSFLGDEATRGMKLTRASTYALQAAAYLAELQDDAPTASHVIARDRGISEKFLLKVLKPLVVVKVLLSVKGPRGGYRLARPASEISLLEIVEAVDGPIRGTTPNGEVLGLVLQKLEAICQQTADQIRAHLGGIKLSDLSRAEV